MLIFNILWELRERNNKFSLGMKLSQLVEKVSIEEGWMVHQEKKRNSRHRCNMELRGNTPYSGNDNRPLMGGSRDRKDKD